MNGFKERPFPILVRGIGDVGSAVSVLLFRAGYPVALHDEPEPATSRRSMAFTDAVFDGTVALEGITARRVDMPAALRDALVARDSVPLSVAPFEEVLKAVNWSVLIDARLRKRAVPERQQGLVPLTLGLRPIFIAGETVDLAIETAWDEHLGQVIRSGATLPFGGEPRSLGGAGRARFVYAPSAGRFETTARNGNRVESGEVVATIGTTALTAPLSGVIRGLTRSGVSVGVAAKVIEVDPPGDRSTAFGLGERPRRIAEGVCRALAENLTGHPW